MQNFETTKATRCVCVPWHVEIKHCFPFCIIVNDIMAYGRNQAMRSIRLPYKLSHTPVFIHPSIICATFRTKNKYNSCNCSIQGSKYTTNRPVWHFLFFTPLCNVQCDFRVHDMDATSAINRRYSNTLNAMNHHQLLVSCHWIVLLEWKYSIIKPDNILA